MFDVFHIQLPELALVPGLEIRRRESAFGLSDDEFVFLDDVKFGRLVLASAAYGNVELWTGSSERSGWIVLEVGPIANEAAVTDEIWAAFLTALTSLLDAHSNWRVICESDCDQHPPRKMHLSPAALAAHLASLRRDHVLPIALVATPA